jgi:hypothetical protein
VRKWIMGILVALVVASGIFWATADKDMRRLILNIQTNRDVLFRSISQRDAAFRAMVRMPVFSKSRIIPTSQKIHPLPKGAFSMLVSMSMPI